MSRSALLATLVAIPLAACQAGPETPAAAPADPRVLMEADSAFDAAVADGGSEAWAGFFAEDGALIRAGDGEISGRAAVGAAMTALDDPDFSLRWTPTRADIATSGDLGWTTGTYESRARGPDGEVVTGTGIYVSIWRKQADGSWKVVMDLGNPTGPPPGPGS